MQVFDALVGLKWPLYLAFFILLSAKLETSPVTLPWAIVFLPLLVTNCTSLHQKIRETREIFRNGERRRRLLLRQAASAVDIIGGIGFYIGLTIFLSTMNSFTNYYGRATRDFTLHYCFFPLWISVVVSTSMRLCTYLIPGIESPRFLRATGPFYTFAGTVVIFTVRGVQPLLILLKIYGAINDNWSAVLAPGWIMVFIGIGMAVISMATSSATHPSTSPQLRKQAQTFIGMWCFHVVVASLTLLLFLTWIVQKLDGTVGSASDHTITTILAPLIATCAIFSLLTRWLHNMVANYQYYLRSPAHQNAEQGLLAAASHQTMLEAVTEKTWLIQISSTLYRAVPYTASMDSQLAKQAYYESDIALYSMETIDFVGLCLSACSSGDIISGFCLRNFSDETPRSARRTAGDHRMSHRGPGAGVTTTATAREISGSRSTASNAPNFGITNYSDDQDGYQADLRRRSESWDISDSSPPPGQNSRGENSYTVYGTSSRISSRQLLPSLTGVDSEEPQEAGAVELTAINNSTGRGDDTTLQLQSLHLREEGGVYTSVPTLPLDSIAIATGGSQRDGAIDGVVSPGSVDDVSIAERSDSTQSTGTQSQEHLLGSVSSSGRVSVSEVDIRGRGTLANEPPAFARSGASGAGFNATNVNTDNASVVPLSSSVRLSPRSYLPPPPPDTHSNLVSAYVQGGGSSGNNDRDMMSSLLPEPLRSTRNRSGRNNTSPRAAYYSSAVTTAVAIVATHAATTVAERSAQTSPRLLMPASTADGSDGQCIVCFNRVQDACLMNCGHVVMCFQCASLVARHMPSHCPVCRQDISKVLRITVPPFPIREGGFAAVSSEGYHVRTDIVETFIRATAHTRLHPRDPNEVRQRQHAPFEEQAGFLGVYR